MKKMIILSAITLAACRESSKHAYKTEVTFFDGNKDTITVRAWEENNVYLGSKGCVETPTSVEACGVRTFKILVKE